MSSINIDHLAMALCNKKVMVALTESLKPIIQAAIDEALKSCLDELFSTVKYFQSAWSEVASRDDRIVHLEKESLSLRTFLSQQAQPIDALEIHSRSSNLVMYGLAESYSETTTSSGRRDVDEVVSINQPYQKTSIRSQSGFIQFCRQKLNLEIRPDDIVNCHRLQKSTQSIHRLMVIRFASQRVRAEILSERRRLRA